MLPNLSTEQQAIVQAVSEGKNVIVDSVAGSGKTTTILHIAQSNPQKRTLVLTYNSKLKQETRSKAADLGLTHVEVHSYHAFSVRYYNPSSFTDAGILQALRKDLPPKHPIAYDLIIMDEQQDMIHVYFQLVQKIMTDNTVASCQIALFGDVFQNIYAFKGSDERYLTLSDNLFTSHRPWIRLRMSTSYRITIPIAEFINLQLLGSTRLAAIKDGPPVKYLQCNAFSDNPLNVILDALSTGTNVEDIFILAPSVKKGQNQNPVRYLENRLVECGCPCYVPISDDERLDEDVVKNKIAFATFHQVKGLERRFVMVFNFDDSYFRYYARNTPVNRCPNTIYVATTRAKEQLVLIHHNDNGYMPMVKPAMLPVTCDFIKTHRLRHCPHVTPEVFHTDVTDLTRNLEIDVIDHCMSFLKITKQTTAQKPINIPIKVSTGDGNYESVAEINGIAIPAIYELQTVGHSSIFDMVKLASETLPDEHKERINQLAYIFSTEGKFLDCHVLYIANVYSSITTGYIYKREQIEKYTWFDNRDIDQAIATLASNVSPFAEYEKSFRYPLSDRMICGRVDAIDPTTATLWEFKCTSTLDDCHIIQLAIYAWLINQSTLKNQVTSHKLLNILNGQVFTLEYTDQIETMIEYLIKIKYHMDAPVTDEQFLVGAKTSLKSKPRSKSKNVASKSSYSTTK